MASDRIQRRIERLLDQIEQAFSARFTVKLEPMPGPRRRDGRAAQRCLHRVRDDLGSLKLGFFSTGP